MNNLRESISVLLLRSSCDGDAEVGYGLNEGEREKLHAETNHGRKGIGEGAATHDTFLALWEKTIASSPFTCDVFFVADVHVQYDLQSNNETDSNEHRRRHLLLEDPRAVVKLTSVDLFPCGMENVLTIDDPLKSSYLVSISNCHMIISKDQKVAVEPQIPDPNYRWHVGNSHPEEPQHGELEIQFELPRVKEQVWQHFLSEMKAERKKAMIEEGEIAETVAKTVQTSTSFGRGPPQYHDDVFRTFQSVVESELDCINRLLAVLGVLGVVLIMGLVWAIHQYHKEGRNAKRSRASRASKSSPASIVTVAKENGMLNMSPLSIDSGLAVKTSIATTASKSGVALSPGSKIQARWSHRRMSSRLSIKRSKSILKPINHAVPSETEQPTCGGMRVVTPLRDENQDNEGSNELVSVSKTTPIASLVTPSSRGCEEARTSELTTSSAIETPPSIGHSAEGRSFIQEYWGAE